MKLKSYFLSMLALGALASCSSDDSASDSADSGALEGNSYMAVNLVMASSSDTRAATAGGYVNGTDAENTINLGNSIFLFYDSYGNYLTNGTISGGGTVVPTSNVSGSNSTQSTTATIILGPTTSTPAKVLAVLNVDETTRNNFINQDLSAVTDLMTSVNPSDAGSFVMSNSVYSDTDNSVIVYAQDIDSDNIQTEQANALSNPVDIYVERVVAKVNIGVADAASTYDETSSEYGKYYFDLEDPYLYNDGTASSNVMLRIVVDGLAVNATNSSTRIVKYLKSAWTTDSYPWPGWNSFTNKRSFWAVDQNYEITDNEYQTGVQYKSWADVSGTCSRASDSEAYSYTASGYYHENTASPAASQECINGGDIAATPNLMVAAHIEVSTDGGNNYSEISGTGSAGKIYRNAGTFYTYDGIRNIISNNANNKGYRWRTGSSDAGYTYEETAYDDFECEFTSISRTEDLYTTLVNNNATTLGVVKVSSVTKNSSREEATLVIPGNTSDDDEVVQMAQVLSDVNAGLLITSGLEAFDGGACYYQKPIDHPSVNITAYGLVRNHYYTLTLNSISGVGGAVPDKDDDQDVIPGEQQNYYIAATLNVLSWRTVSQTFDF